MHSLYRKITNVNNFPLYHEIGCVLYRVKANALLNFSGALQGKKKNSSNKNDLSWLCLHPQ